MVSQVAGKSNACSTGCQDSQQSKYQSAPLLALCGGNPLVIGRSPLQWAINAKNISMSWPYHVDRMTRTMTMKQPWGKEVNQSLPYRIVNNSPKVIFGIYLKAIGLIYGKDYNSCLYIAYNFITHLHLPRDTGYQQKCCRYIYIILSYNTYKASFMINLSDITGSLGKHITGWRVVMLKHFPISNLDARWT